MVPCPHPRITAHGNYRGANRAGVRRGRESMIWPRVPLELEFELLMYRRPETRVKGLFHYPSVYLDAPHGGDHRHHRRRSMSWEPGQEPGRVVRAPCLVLANRIHSTASYALGPERTVWNSELPRAVANAALRTHHAGLLYSPSWNGIGAKAA